MVSVFGNAVVLLLSLLVLWITLPPGTLSLESPLAMESAVLSLVVTAAALFAVSVWRVRREGATTRAVQRLEDELTQQRELTKRLEESLQERAARLQRLPDIEAENESLHKALELAAASRDQERREQRNNGRELIHLLSRLQEKGRFVDFVMEDIGGYSDQQVGTAARFVHDGCRSVVREYLDLAPVESGDEGSSITVSQPRHPAELQFLGKSASAFPATGRLVHRGWKVVTSRLPHLSISGEYAEVTDVIAPAQVELM